MAETGHAHADESMTIVARGALLNKYTKHLIRIHLHDAMGIDDHLVPGTGEIDFKKIKEHLNADTLKVIELNQGTPDDQVKQPMCFISETVA